LHIWLCADVYDVDRLFLVFQVAQLLSEKPPIQFLKPSLEPWRGGLLSLEGVVERLRELLPPTFEGLERDFAVGVVTTDGTHVLIDQGPLPEAVAASAAIPFVFSNVDVPGGLATQTWKVSAAAGGSCQAAYLA
jgi:predicted acylesterase/phospholipase RssA